MRKCLLLGCLVTASVLRPAVAAADTMTLTGLGTGAPVYIKIGAVTEYAWAGEINWNLTVNGVTRAVTTYCADLFDDAKNVQSGLFETTSALDQHPNISYGAGANAGSEAAYFVNTYAAGAHGSGVQAAALQIAIWQAMFGANSFTILNTTANYNAIMAAVSGFTLPSGNFSASAGYFDVTNGSAIGSGANGQDQVFVGTPEPATIFLVLVAFMALAVFGRRSLQLKTSTAQIAG